MLVEVISEVSVITMVTHQKVMGREREGGIPTSGLEDRAKICLCNSLIASLALSCFALASICVQIFIADELRADFSLKPVTLISTSACYHGY